MARPQCASIPYLPYISLYLPCISPMSPLYLPYISQEGAPTVRVTFRDALAFNAQLKAGVRVRVRVKR